MMENWFKWAFLLLLATLPYNFYGLVAVHSLSGFAKIGFLVGSFLIVAMFVTGFYWLDKLFIKYGYPNFSQYFLQVIGLKFIGTLVGVLLWFLLKSEAIFYAVFTDAMMTMNFYEFLQSNAHETAQNLITSREWYDMLKDLVLVPIFLMVESGCFLLSMAILVLFKDICGKKETQ